MTRLLGLLVVLMCSFQAHAWPIKVQDMVLDLPQGWTVHQNAKSGDTLIVGLANDDDYFRVYAKRGGADLRSVFSNESEVLSEYERSWGLDFKMIDTKKDSSYVVGFMTEMDGYSYFGYSRSGSQSEAKNVVEGFLETMRGVK